MTLHLRSEGEAVAWGKTLTDQQQRCQTLAALKRRTSLYSLYDAEVIEILGTSGYICMQWSKLEAVSPTKVNGETRVICSSCEKCDDSTGCWLSQLRVPTRNWLSPIINT
jgi:hypothetical protein